MGGSVGGHGFVVLSPFIRRRGPGWLLGGEFVHFKLFLSFLSESFF